MMSGKALVILAIACFAKGIRGESASSAINDYKPIIKELSERIANTAKDSKTKVDTLQIQINTNIDDGMQTIKSSMEETKKTINEATKEADVRGKNIKHCLSTIDEEIKTIDMNEIKTCNPKEQMDAMNSAINNMKKLQSATDRICKDCFWKHPWSSQVEKLKACMEEKAIEMEAAISEETITVTGNLKTASKTYEKCIKKTTKNTTKSIDKMTKNFNKCVKKAYK